MRLPSPPLPIVTLILQLGFSLLIVTPLPSPTPFVTLILPLGVSPLIVTILRHATEVSCFELFWLEERLMDTHMRLSYMDTQMRHSCAILYKHVTLISISRCGKS